MFKSKSKAKSKASVICRIRLPLACILAFAIILPSVFFATFAGVFPASAHMAVNGWLYPAECCNEFDCKQLDDSEVTIGSDYYIWKDKHIAFGSPRIRPSPDRFYHACENAHWGDTSGQLEITCFFVPAGG